MNKSAILLKLYQLFTLLAAPFITLYLIKRKKEGKEDLIRFRERFGRTNYPRKSGKLIWVHAASVGEILSVLPLIDALSKAYAEYSILVTTGTVSSAEIAIKRLPENAFHQYIVIDRFDTVRRFLNYWRPSLALWVESEIWPNLILETAKTCPIMLLNARMSERSFAKWQRYSDIFAYLGNQFAEILAQSEKSAERFKKLGLHRVKHLGNLKYDAPALPSDSQKMGELVPMIGERTIWLAASTHKGEESIIGAIHNELKADIPDLLTIITPRHPKRGSMIAADLRKKDLTTALRSEGTPIKADTDVYIADTLGELGLFYRLASIVFIGGTLVEHGGQNPLEPARLECAVVFGPYMDNFHEITEEILKAEAAIRVHNETELTNHIRELLTNHEQTQELADKIKEITEQKSGILQHYVEEITPFISG